MYSIEELLEKVTQFQNLNESELMNISNYVLGFDTEGNPNIVNGEVLYKFVEILKKINNFESIQLINKRFLDGSDERYIQLIKPLMKEINSQEFFMGSDTTNPLAYCGEYPQHKVKVEDFLLTSTVITNELYQKYNPAFDYETDPNCPATNVTWYDAYMFAMWVGCRLPTEAEWELASAKEKDSNWCCEEECLEEYAWFSENSDGYIHKVKKLKPNRFGLYDMHGNIWEWTLDSYNELFYETSPKDNPINLENNNLKVCRGGSIQGFSEMCRSAFRYYEPINYKTADLGFRILKERK